MRRSRFCFVAALAAALVLGLGALALAEPVNFTFATFIPPNEPGAEVGLWIEKEMNEKPDSLLKAKFFHSQQMGNEIEIVKKVRMGTLNAALCPSTYAPDLNPKFGIATLAYCMNSYEKWEAFRQEKALRDELFLCLQGVGLRTLDFCYFGVYGLATTKPVSTLDDLKVMKMRTTQARYPLAFWHALGVRPVPMAWGDVFPALKQGVVEGTDQTDNVMRLRLTDVCKYFTKTDHMVGLFYLLVNDKWYQGLDAKARQQLDQVVQANFAKARAASMKLTQEAPEELKAKGVTVINLPKEEMDKFRQAQRGVWKEFEPEVGKEWLDKITMFSAQF